MSVTVNDLGSAPKGAFLYCEFCQARYSATAGDYFWKPLHEPFACEQCAVQLVLATASTRIAVVQS